MRSVGFGRAASVFSKLRWLDIPILLALAALPGTRVDAAVQMSTGISDSSLVHVMSWAEIPFRSVVRQQYDFSCGSAAVATLLSFSYHRATPERPVFDAMWQAGEQPMIRKLGFSMLDIKRYLDGIGLRTEGYRLSLQQLQLLGQPGIVILNLNGYKHFVVVKGSEAGQLLVGDPMLGLSRYSAADFATHWNGVFLMIVRPIGRSPSFNLTSDWGPWASAPLRHVAFGTPTGTLTNNLPPLYQITGATLSGLSATASR